MLRLISILAALLFFAPPLLTLADDETGPPSERSSAFVKGEADPSEAFGETEGPLLLILGLAGIASIFAILIVANRAQNSSREELLTIEKKIMPKGDTNAS